MAFSKTGLGHYVQGKEGFSPSIYTYRSDDALATIEASGYFDNGATTNTGMRNVLKKGDVILLNAAASGTMTIHWRAVANVTAAGVITIAALTA
jgi:hypothetical protein